MPTDLKQYYPKIYDSVRETDELIKTENILFDDLNTNTQVVFNNQFILKADIDGILRFENIFGIIANPITEDLEFRQQRIINRLSMKGPLSLPALRVNLDKIIGKDKYTVDMDYANYTLYIESAAENQVWFEEIYVTIINYKPANIVFINRPLVTARLNLSETTSYTAITYNYKLGTTWLLGQKMFAAFEDKGVVKLANVASIQQELLNSTAGHVAGTIAKALINNTYEVTAFKTKASTNNIATIEYTVPSTGSGISEITNIKLFDANGNILSNNSVYIPVLDDVILKHNIKAVEGV